MGQHLRAGFRTAVVTASAGLLAVAGVLASAGPASAAGTTLTAQYKVTGNTTLKAPNATLPLGPGKLTSTVDLTTGALTANLSLPNATGSFKEFGLIPVTATAQLINAAPTTGSVNLSTGAVTATSMITMRIVDLNVAGLDIPVGPACQTATPVSVTVNSQPGFNILKGGNLAGTYTVPPFANCGLATLLINLTLPGPGNTITLHLGKAKVIG